MKKFLLASAAFSAMCMPLAAGNSACSGDVSFQDAVSYDLQITYKASDFTKKESHLAEYDCSFTRKGSGVDACVKYTDLVFDQYQKLPNGKEVDFKISTKLMNNYHSELVKGDILPTPHPITIGPEGKVIGEPIRPVDKTDTTLDYRAIMLLPWVRDVYSADYSAGVVSPVIIRNLGALSSIKAGDSITLQSQYLGAVRGCFSTTYKCEEASAGVLKFSVRGTVRSCEGVACQVLESGELIDLYDEDGSIDGSVVVDGKRGVVTSGSLRVRLNAMGLTTRTTKHIAVGKKYPIEIEQTFNIGSSARR